MYAAELLILEICFVSIILRCVLKVPAIRVACLVLLLAANRVMRV